MEQASKESSVRDIMADPYSLNPVGERTGADGPDDNTALFDEDFSQWTSPFVMAAVNTRVVRRSNALSKNLYGKNFSYDERQLTGTDAGAKRKAKAIAMGTKLTPTVMSFAPVRNLAARFLPSPGEGPSPEEQHRGHFELFFHGTNSESGNALKTRLAGDRDPGYGSTSRMLGEAAVCLARDDLSCQGGIWTPATAMGDLLIKRLANSAGITFERV
jgi:short subunit dehydrogenase-like uncharacterized protein